jgi:hypothetical protein
MLKKPPGFKEAFLVTTHPAILREEPGAAQTKRLSPKLRHRKPTKGVTTVKG